MNKFENIKTYINNKKTSLVNNKKLNLSLSAVEFFYNKKKQKPIIKKVVLPEKEQEVFLSICGYQLNKTYVNPNLFNTNNTNKQKQTKPIYNDIVIEM